MFIDRDWDGEYFSNINLVWPPLDFWFPSCLKGQEVRVVHDFLGVCTIMNAYLTGHFQIKHSFNYWDSLAMIRGMSMGI